MNFDFNLLYGIYDLHEIKSYKNGERTAERAKSGMFVFTRDNRLSVVSGSEGWVMAYTGSFEIQDDILLIHAESCSVRELEGTTMMRKILKLDAEELVLETFSKDREIKSEICWRKKVGLVDTENRGK